MDPQRLVVVPDHSLREPGRRPLGLLAPVGVRVEAHVHVPFLEFGGPAPPAALVRQAVHDCKTDRYSFLRRPVGDGAPRITQSLLRALF